MSKRDNNFRKRGIEKGLLTTVLSQIKALFRHNYIKLESNKDIEEEFIKLKLDGKNKDDNFEFIIFKGHNNMSDTETIYYYIRNAFAHGSFEVKKMGNHMFIF